MSDLASYIQQSRKAGLTDDQIKSSLIQADWTEDQFNPILNPQALIPPAPPIPPKAPTQTQNSGSTNMWTTFEYILMFISLYTVVTSAAIIMHYFVDKTIPDPSSYSSYDYGYNSESIKWAIAAIIVTLPLFSYFTVDLIRRTKKNPAILELTSRKRLIYITLIITFIIFIWNLVKAIFGFLDGAIIVNSLLHFIVTMGISGSIFGYFFTQVKNDHHA